MQTPTVKPIARTGLAGAPGAEECAAAVATIRASLGEGADGEAVRRLARLTESSPVNGAVVLAEICGEPVAAVAIADGRAVADPARSTPQLIAHLRLHRLQVRVIGGIWGI